MGTRLTTSGHRKLGIKSLNPLGPLDLMLSSLERQGFSKSDARVVNGKMRR